MTSGDEQPGPLLLSGKCYDVCLHIYKQSVHVFRDPISGVTVDKFVYLPAGIVVEDCCNGINAYLAPDDPRISRIWTSKMTLTRPKKPCCQSMQYGIPISKLVFTETIRALHVWFSNVFPSVAIGKLFTESLLLLSSENSSDSEEKARGKTSRTATFSCIIRDEKDWRRAHNTCIMH